MTDEEGTQEGGSHGEEYLDGVGLPYQVQDGVVARLYGGLGYRYWLGTPGPSALVAGSVQFWEPVRAVDRAEFEGNLRIQVRDRVRDALLQRTGMWVSGADLDRIEWLGIWQAEPDLLDRLAAFEQGWSRSLPPGKRARDLGSADLGRLTRQLGLHRPRVKRVMTQ